MSNKQADTINHLVKNIAESLLHRDKKLSLAESCTGGWIAKVLTDLAGSSAWFERGFVTYTNQSKIEMLGVNAATLDTFGAVSEATVTEMALGVLQNSHADYSLSVSGIAGPSGGSKDKPVGLVWFAWATKNNVVAEHKIFNGDRDAVRRQSVEYALTGLIKLLSQI